MAPDVLTPAAPPSKSPTARERLSQPAPYLTAQGEPSRYVRWFEHITKSDVALVGGKGANLGEMTRAGFPVPPGFVVTVDAYRRYECFDRVGSYRVTIAAPRYGRGTLDAAGAIQRLALAGALDAGGAVAWSVPDPDFKGPVESYIRGWGPR